MEKYLHDLFDGAIDFLIGLTPAALGAAVSLSYEKGLTWAERFTQFAVGVIVSFYASRVTAVAWALLGWGTIDPFVLQGITFTLGMIAFKATPKLIEGSVSVIGNLPTALADRLLSWLPKKKDPE